MQPQQADVGIDIQTLLASMGLPATPAGGLSLATLPAWALFAVNAWRLPRVQSVLASVVAWVTQRSAVWGPRLGKALIWDLAPPWLQWLSPLLPSVVGSCVAVGTGAADWKTGGVAIAWGVVGAMMLHFGVSQPAGTVATMAASKLAAFAPRSGKAMGSTLGVFVKVDHEEVAGAAQRGIDDRAVG